MTDEPRLATPVEAAQLDVLTRLITGGCLTADGLMTVRGWLVHDPAYQSVQGRRAAVVAMHALAEARGWPPSDDPAWPGDGDPVWDVELPQVPDTPPSEPPRW